MDPATCVARVVPRHPRPVGFAAAPRIRTVPLDSTVFFTYRSSSSISMIPLLSALVSSTVIDKSVAPTFPVVVVTDSWLRTYELISPRVCSVNWFNVAIMLSAPFLLYQTCGQPIECLSFWLMQVGCPACGHLGMHLILRCSSSAQWRFLHC